MGARRAIVRPPSIAFTKCLSSHTLRHTVNIVRAREQHARYVSTLKDIGLDVIVLNAQSTLPDACFVEDTAVIHNNRAFITRPKPLPRRYEIATIQPILEQFFECKIAMPPATIEGGDIIHFGNQLISGISQRTNHEGVAQMQSWLDVPVDIIKDPAIMHLKSYLTAIDDMTFVGTDRFLGHPVIQGYRLIRVPEAEQYAANTLTINDRVLLPAGHPVTAQAIRELDYDVIELEMTEFQKCDGALTCLSLIFK